MFGFSLETSLSFTDALKMDLLIHKNVSMSLGATLGNAIKVHPKTPEERIFYLEEIKDALDEAFDVYSIIKDLLKAPFAEPPQTDLDGRNMISGLFVSHQIMEACMMNLEKEIDLAMEREEEVVSKKEDSFPSKNLQAEIEDTIDQANTTVEKIRNMLEIF